MADGTEQQIPVGASAGGPPVGDPSTDSLSTESPNTDSTNAPDAHFQTADTGHVARIVAALRKAHAEQAAAASTPTGTTSPRRATSGVRSTKPDIPTLRWNPGARYRASRLATDSLPQTPGPQTLASQTPASQTPVPPPPVPQPPVPQPPVPQPPQQFVAVSGVLDAPALGPEPGPESGATIGQPPVPAPPALAGRLFRGPARRTGVFDREIWNPVQHSSRVPRDVSEALIAAVERYRKGSISTSGLVQAIGRAHAA